VAYLKRDVTSGLHVYSFDGTHLGWFVGAVIRDHEGDTACAVKERFKLPQLSHSRPLITSFEMLPRALLLSPRSRLDLEHRAVAEPARVFRVHYAARSPVGSGIEILLRMPTCRTLRPLSSLAISGGPLLALPVLLMGRFQGIPDARPRSYCSSSA